MKFLSKLIVLIFIVGLVLTIIAFSSGVNLSNLGSYFVDDEAYGDPIEYVSTTTIDHLNVDVDTRNVIVSTTSGDSIIVTYRSHEDDIWTLSESAGTLNIIQTTKPVVFHWFNFKFASYEILTITIEIPESLILDYTIQSDTGDIIYNDGPELISAMDIQSHTGRVELSEASMDSLTIEMNTGTMNLSNLTISGNLDGQTSTGNIYLDHVAANLIDLDTNTGKVKGEYIAALDLTASSNTGRVELNYSTLSGDLNLSTSTGAVKLKNTLAHSYDLSTHTGSVTFESTTSMDLKYDLDTATGNITINGSNQGSTHSTTTGTVLLKIRVGTGSITVSVQD